MSVENITNSKNRFIISGLATALSFLILLAAIHTAIKIAFIICAAIITYSLLLLIHGIAKDLTVDGVRNDGGYEGCVDENEEQNAEISVQEQERIQAELEGELRNEQARKYMVEGLPRDPIDISGNPITSKAQGVENGCSVDYTQAMVVPYKISLGVHDKTHNEQLDWAEQMPSLPTHMNVIGNTIPFNPSLSLLKMVRENVDNAMKSNHRGADIAATMRVPSTISINSINQQINQDTAFSTII